ncbi:MAG: MBL fold metallo-hydrolase, partial [Desulfobacterales bacterium]|nr:MBL fold metallo-hydrolase [Desulfobacterales bacterium]
MKVTFYGTRGSMPVPDTDYMHYGGNTSCILVTFSKGRVAILDAGTGIRKLGNDLLRNAHEQYGNISIILSHTHWDHIQGFPFFDPAY